MSARVLLVCGLSFAAFLFLSVVWGIYRRVRRTREAWARLAFQKQLVHTQDTADDAEQTVWGIG